MNNTAPMHIARMAPDISSRQPSRNKWGNRPAPRYTSNNQCTMAQTNRALQRPCRLLPPSTKHRRPAQIRPKSRQPCPPACRIGRISTSTSIDLPSIRKPISTRTRPSKPSFQAIPTVSRVPSPWRWQRDLARISTRCVSMAAPDWAKPICSTPSAITR